jgi:hypothetical protein
LRKLVLKLKKDPASAAGQAGFLGSFFKAGAELGVKAWWVPPLLCSFTIPLSAALASGATCPMSLAYFVLV